MVATLNDELDGFYCLLGSNLLLTAQVGAPLNVQKEQCVLNMWKDPIVKIFIVQC